MASPKHNRYHTLQRKIHHKLRHKLKNVEIMNKKLNVVSFFLILISLFFLVSSHFSFSPKLVHANTIFHDSFQDINGTPLETHNPIWTDKLSVGHGGRFLIENNSAQLFPAGNEFSYVINNLGTSANECFSVDLNLNSNDINTAGGLQFYIRDGHTAIMMSNNIILLYSNGSGGPNQFSNQVNATVYSGTTHTYTLCDLSGNEVFSIDGNTIATLANSGVTDQNTTFQITGGNYNGYSLILNNFYLDDGTITLPNLPPQLNSFSDRTINEGDTYSASGSFTDPDSSGWTGTVDYGDGTGIQPLTLTGTNFTLSHIYKDNGTYTLIVSITDNQGTTGSGTATVTVNNVAPIIGTISVATSPVQVNTVITASASFTDPGVLDTHSASWNWGDSNSTAATITETNGSGSLANTHTYTATGVYPVTLTVTDNNNGTSSSTYQYIVVYDASAGWIKGDKEFISPAGAITGNADATGKANFGFQVKYQNNSMVPSGKNISLSFPTGNINFASTSYEWLVVNGSKATFKADGTLNGSAGYTILVSAIDQGNGNASGLIRFQIKDTDNNVVYDTQSGATDTTDPTTPVSKGNINIH